MTQLFFLGIICICELINKIQAEFGPDCLVHNKEYKFEYLASTYYSTHPSKSTEVSRVYLTRLEKLKKDFDAIKWSISKSNKRSQTFYLRSQKYDEYLCASTKVDSFLGRRRSVQTFKLEKSELHFYTQCEWKLRQLSNDSFLIWNDYYKEPLYTASRFFNLDVHKRSVFLWNGRLTGLDNTFKWIVDCRGRHFHWI
jgi:hypothetical protein